MTGLPSTLDRSAGLPPPSPPPPRLPPPPPALPPHESTPVVRRTTRSSLPTRPVLIAIGTAVALGIGAAGGSIVRGSGTTANTVDALPYALIGALTAIAVVAAAYWAVVTAWPHHRQSARRLLLPALLVGAAIGGLLGAAATPSGIRSLEEPPAPPEPTVPERDSFLPEGSIAGPVDRDGDGVPDRDVDGNLIVGADVDGDAVYDAVFVACDSGPGAAPDVGADEIVFDAGCDGDVDQIIPYRDELLVDPEPAQSPPATGQPALREPSSSRIDDVLVVAVSILFAAFAMAALLTLAVTLRRRRRATGSALPPPTHGDSTSQDHDMHAIVETLRDSIDALDDPDPRRAICAAYGRLLDGLATCGVPRRPEEAPEEHIRRCLGSTAIRVEPVRQLLDLFAFARFSVHPITDDHRAAALDALRAALADLGVAERAGARR